MSENKILESVAARRTQFGSSLRLKSTNMINRKERKVSDSLQLLTHMREGNNKNKVELPAICRDPEVAQILGRHPDWVAFLDSKQLKKLLAGTPPSAHTSGFHAKHKAN